MRVTNGIPLGLPLSYQLTLCKLGSNTEGRADWFFVLAKTDPSAKAGSAFSAR
jgi:hypothetical protein